MLLRTRVIFVPESWRLPVLAIRKNVCVCHVYTYRSRRCRSRRNRRAARDTQKHDSCANAVRETIVISSVATGFYRSGTLVTQIKRRRVAHRDTGALH